MEKILFEDATLTSQAKVTIDGVDHLVTEAEYSGGTDLNANTFNQLQDNVEKAINGVIESGSNENGSWIKYEDGTMIQVKEITGTSSAFTQTGSLYYKTIELGNWAIEFTDILNVQTTVKGLAMFGGNVDDFTITSIGSTRIYKPDATSVSHKIEVLGIGKWK